MLVDERMVAEARVGTANLCAPSSDCHTNVRVLAVARAPSAVVVQVSWQMAQMSETESLDDHACPLCGAHALSPLLRDAGRRFFRCSRCDLVSVHPADRPTRSEEAQRYLAHENDRADDGYVRFLRRLADPICAVVPFGAHGIDVGCGPAPVLAELLTQGGRPTESYDPLFFPRGDLLNDTYDFVTCCEVVEHAHDPAGLFALLAGLIRSGGTIAVMTSLHDATTQFETWWYARDITHVCFFSARTMSWIGGRFGLEFELAAPTVVLFRG